MKRKYTTVLYLIIVLCIASSVYCASVIGQRDLNYQTTFVEVLNFFVLSPLLWTCIGLLIGSLVRIRKCVTVTFRTSMKILSFAAVLIYACTAIMYALGVNMPWIYTITALCTMHPLIFVVPGLLFSISAK